MKINILNLIISFILALILNLFFGKHEIKTHIVSHNQEVIYEK